MKSPFEKSFCGKSPLKELTAKQEANLPEALKKAIEAKSPTNYGSPLEQEVDPEKTKYQDSVQTLHKGAHKEYLKRKKEGYKISDDDSQTFNFIQPETDPTKIKSLKEFAYAKEIAKGGSTKDSKGRVAGKLARIYK
jgi:hypothetical protein